MPDTDANILPADDPPVVPTQPPTGDGAMSRHLSLNATLSNSPLPSAEVLHSYEDLVPGASNSIIRMIEEEGRHRRGLEKKRLNAEIKAQTETLLALKADQEAQRRENSRSQYLAIVAIVVCVAGGVVAAIWGSPWMGGIFATLGVMTFAGKVYTLVEQKKADQKLSTPPQT